MPSLRKAKKNDVINIWNIRTQAILKVCTKSYAEDVILSWANSPMPEDFGKILLQFGAIVLEEQGDLVGFGFIDTERGSLKSLFISPQYIGRGYGKQIAEELEYIAKTAGVQTIKVSSSLNAVEFYKSIGFKAGKIGSVFSISAEPETRRLYR
ncbi:GNAT family N-acetyltransferase [Photobacterium kishitanii]|uniref:GNAT family N-acetyltransferase n=1 Tax=Photobacterium kishitanii TaxID=318456 RepID=UPI000D16D481|nr:GNAT family N-acetyltransferase [Photobacterium kishitanii]PSW44954.1 hypothetical protein C0W66_22785 [Photobacterium kishitanii]